MKSQTLKNLIGVLFFSALALVALVGALMYSAWWHIFTAAMMGLLARIMYTDEDYGTESVKEYFHNRHNQNQ